MSVFPLPLTELPLATTEVGSGTGAGVMRVAEQLKSDVEPPLPRPATDQEPLPVG